MKIYSFTHKMDIYNIENGHFLVLKVLFAVILPQQKKMFLVN